MTTTREVPEAFASMGAVRQTGGRLPVYSCDTCHGDVAWATSKRTGRKYLVNVQRGHLDQRFYMGNDIHRCDQRLAMAEQITREGRRLAAGERLNQKVRASRNLWRDGTITEDQMIADLAMFEAEYAEDMT